MFSSLPQAKLVHTLQEDALKLLQGFLSNLIQPQLLAATPNEEIHIIDYGDVANQLSNDKLGIGSAVRLLLIEKSDELERAQEEGTFFQSVRDFYVECV